MATNLTPEVFKLACGVEVFWQPIDAFHKNYQLNLSNENNIEVGCGNPWNLMTEEEEKLIRMKKPSESCIPCNLESMMYHAVLNTKNDLVENIKNNMCGDCWGIFTTTSDRKKMLKLYYDARNSKHESMRGMVSLEVFRQMRDDESRELERLRNDPTDLINDIDNGHTLVLVYGGQNFLEEYFFRSGNSYVIITVDHSVTW